jgi:hypothetical protein
MNTKKAVGIGVLVVLLATCLILARAWSDVNQNFNEYVEFHHHYDSEFEDLEFQLRELNDTLNLKKSTIWVDNQTVSQSAGDYTSWTLSPSYAGYLEILLSSSTTPNTYVEVLVPSGYGIPPQRINGAPWGGYIYNNFPVLPLAPVEIRVGNTNTVANATETVTITYHY